MTTTETETAVQAGQIFVNTWGYDQTNTDFYEVVRVTPSGKSAEVKPIGSRAVESNGPAGNRVVPDRRFTREWDVILGIERDDKKRTKTCKIDQWGNLVLRSKGGRHTAARWDGRPMYETDIMFGH
jgi:hypothetical protein